MHLLVTGGTGFFGKSLLRYWKSNKSILKNYSKITLLSRRPHEFEVKYKFLLDGLNISIYEGDILQPNFLPDNRGVNHILHAATDSTLGPQLPLVTRYDQIVTGTRNVLDYSVRNKVSKVLYVSSGGVYGRQPSNMSEIVENYCGMPDVMDPKATYGVAKRAAEHLCTLYADAYGIEIPIARCFAFVGQDLPIEKHFAIGNFIRDALFNNQIIVSGNGKQLRSYMHQNDLAKWLMLILDNGKSMRAYNVGSDEVISIKELAFLIRDLLAPSKIVVVKDLLESDDSRNVYIPSILRSKIELGLSLDYDLIRAIKQTASEIKYA